MGQKSEVLDRDTHLSAQGYCCWGNACCGHKTDIMTTVVRTQIDVPNVFKINYCHPINDTYDDVW